MYFFAFLQMVRGGEDAMRCDAGFLAVGFLERLFSPFLGTGGAAIVVYFKNASGTHSRHSPLPRLPSARTPTHTASAVSEELVLAHESPHLVPHKRVTCCRRREHQTREMSWRQALDRGHGRNTASRTVLYASSPWSLRCHDASKRQSLCWHSF